MPRSTTRPGEPMSFVMSVSSAAHGDECIIWPYGKNAFGYGSVRFRGRAVLAHRLICTIAHGDPPTKGYEAAHSCGVRACCNPAHLRWATHAENQRDKITHGTANAPRGENHHRSKLSEADVRAIKNRLATDSNQSIAADYGVSDTTVSAIRTGQNWSWL